jgi:hypothetical protein
MQSEFENDSTKIEALWHAVKNNLAPKMSGWTYGMIGFGIMDRNSVKDCKWIINPTIDPTRVSNVKELQAMGSTPMLAGLELAWGWVKDHASKARFILISDGVPTDCSRDQMFSNCSNHKNIPIDTIGIGKLGNSYDEQLLKKISEITGGIFSRVNSINTLTNTLEMLSPEKRLLLGTVK